MTERLEFEVILERRLCARADLARRPFDAVEIARGAVAAAPARRRLALPVFDRPAWGMVLLGVLLLLALGALAAGVLLRQRPEPLLAVARRDGVYLVHQDGIPVVRLADTGTYPRFAWSADGQLLLIQDVFSGGNEVRLSAYGLEGTLLWTTSEAATDFVGWSHHGHRIAWVSGPGHWLRLTDVDTGTTEFVESKASGVWGGTSWSPDDDWVLVSGEDLSIVPLDGSKLRATSLAPGYQVQYATVSPDGRLIAAMEACIPPACTQNRVDLAIRDATTGDEVLRLPAAGGYPIAWSPDGLRVGWRAISPNPAAVMTTTPTSRGATVAATGTDGVQFSGWTPDGSILAIEFGPAGDCDTTGCPWTGGSLWRVGIDGLTKELLMTDISEAALQPVP